MAETDKMLCGKRTTELVIDSQRVFAVNPLTDDHRRTLTPRPLPRGSEERIDHHDAIHPLVQVGGSGDEVTSTTGSAQCTYQQVLIGRLKNVLQTGGDLADVPSVEMSGDQPDGLRSTRSKTRGVRIGHVAQRVCDIANTLTDLGTHMGKVAKRSTDGRLGNAGTAGNVGDRGRARQSRHAVGSPLDFSLRNRFHGR